MEAFSVSRRAISFFAFASSVSSFFTCTPRASRSAVSFSLSAASLPDALPPALRSTSAESSVSQSFTRSCATVALSEAGRSAR